MAFHKEDEWADDGGRVVGDEESNAGDDSVSEVVAEPVDDIEEAAGDRATGSIGVSYSRDPKTGALIATYKPIT